MNSDKFTAEFSRLLDSYNADIVAAVNSLSERAVADIAEETRKTAPKRKRGGAYRRSITSGIRVQKRTGNTYSWYCKNGMHRLTHLLVNGHATVNGGRTKADPFLLNAVNRVIPKYEKDVEEAVRNA